MKDGGFNDKFGDERLQDAARQYNEPPETPREAMWSRIQTTRNEQRAQRRKIYKPARAPFWRSFRLWVPAAAAAVLVIGISIGRLTAPGDDAEVAAGGGEQTELIEPTEVAIGTPIKDSSSQIAFKVAAAPVLNKAELLLTQFKSGEEMGDNGDSYTKRAKSLLMDTRLLLNSPAADDPKLRQVLFDLELVLIQIVRIAGDREEEQEEREIINDNMNDRSLLPRLRANVPTGTFTITS
jgi:hypothetical protein